MEKSDSESRVEKSDSESSEEKSDKRESLRHKPPLLAPSCTLSLLIMNKVI